MATAVVLPKQGNSVESCVIKMWLKKPGDAVKEGDGLCEVETDKATVEVPAPASGTLLAIFRPAGDDVAVMTNIAAIGQAGEEVSGLAGSPAAVASTTPEVRKTARPEPVAAPAVATEGAGTSPRARAAAAERGIDARTLGGSGPGGLVIERDVLAAPMLTAAAKAVPGALPPAGTGIGGRITAADRSAAVISEAAPADVPVKGIRKIIAERMRASLSGSAQLTLNATAKAVMLQAWRAKAKAQAEVLGLPGITVNDLVLFAVSRVLPRFPALNAHFLGDRIRQFGDVHLGMAVDTERGLLVPVLKDAARKTLAQIAGEAKALAKAAQAGKASPEQLTGSTFSISNMGALGIESFTPVLNTPEVAILGVGCISLRPYQGATDVEFLPSMHLSLTIDHQALDGAPAARFLQALCQAIEHIDVLLAA